MVEGAVMAHNLQVEGIRKLDQCTYGSLQLVTNATEGFRCYDGHSSWQPLFHVVMMV